MIFKERIVKKIFVVLIVVLMFFSFDCFANFAIGLATGAAVGRRTSYIKYDDDDDDIEAYKKEIDNLKIELNECKKILENNDID